ncbi:hypothetical protein L484_019125 [Morus notabilis]|uniref:Uncharacterized protein n=1 Tax=Morus notabilis TaxID=981085 RepID=W9SJ93_9ROSA|nr:hypothetical protein L484_019125 [Morus notabilis]
MTELPEISCSVSPTDDIGPRCLSIFSIDFRSVPSVLGDFVQPPVCSRSSFAILGPQYRLIRSGLTWSTLTDAAQDEDHQRTTAGRREATNRKLPNSFHI